MGEMTSSSAAVHEYRWRYGTGKDPQVAEVGMTQVTYAEEILNVDKAAGRLP